MELLKNNEASLIILLILAVRTTMTLAANSAGITGGTFIPILALGALVASAVGEALLALGVDSGLYTIIIILGITACVSGSMKMPLTAIIFSVEALSCHANIIPVVIAVFIAYLVTVVLHMVFRYYFNDTSKLVNLLIYCNTNYSDVLTLFAAVCIFLIFCGIKSNGSLLHRFICYIGGCTFGVYLFHEAPQFRGIIYDKIFVTSKYWGHPQASLIVIGFSLILFTAGFAMESLRKLIFLAVKTVIARIKNEMNTPESEK